MKAVVVYSGGMDSYTVLRRALDQGREVTAFSLDYGQRHRKELDFAQKVTRDLRLEHVVLDASFLSGVLKGSSLTSPEVAVPTGHYADPTMKETVVPNRNMILLSLAIGVAVANDAGEVWCGVHAGDHAIYPDCRPDFINPMREVARVANYSPVEIVTPFLHQSKTEILAYGLRDLAIPPSNYKDTWTCYNGKTLACGKCGACVERLEAFRDCGAEDPLLYEAEL